jgi:DNA-binding MarR family transcriptional regulator
MKSYNKIDKVLAYFQEEVHNQFQLHQFRLLLLLAVRDPDPVPYDEVCKRLGLSNAAVSRNSKQLGVHMVKGEDGWKDVGLGLIDVRPDIYETRRNVMSLTDKGRKVMTGLNTLM